MADVGEVATPVVEASGVVEGSDPREEGQEEEGTAVETDQEERRQELLEEQKNWQFNYDDHVYRLTRDSWEEEADLERDEAFNVPVKSLHKPGWFYKYQLMLPEFLMELPQDLAEEWLMVPCPWGKRCLVVSSQGSTMTFDEGGFVTNEFPSLLPGGSRKHLTRGDKENTILDCIYHGVEKTFYVLDIMCWNDQHLYDNETELRFFWLRSRLQETPDVATISHLNPHKFVPLESYPGSKEGIESALESTNLKIDGCMFYHKHAHYMFGPTPLAFWLKPFMIAELVGVVIHADLMSQKPVNYTTYQAHLKHRREMERLGSGRGRQRSSHTATADRGPKPEKPRGPDRAQKVKMNQLMMSQWLLEVPDDFQDDWLTVVCPVGGRRQVIAIDGETKAFSKNGFKLPGYFVSLLPGGSLKFSKGTMTLLDCILDETTETYFVLDVINWDGVDQTSQDTESRFKLLRQEMNKMPGIKVVQPPYNHHKFVVLKNYPCTKEGIAKAVQATRFEIDGLLFFRKQAVYTPGSTSDVLWTKPYMLPEVLDVPVSVSFLHQKPDAYTTFTQFVEDTRNGITVESKKKKKKKKSAQFVPSCELSLPDPETFNKQGVKKNKKIPYPPPQQQLQQAPYGYKVYRFGGQGQFVGRGRGQPAEMHKQGRILRGGSAGNGRVVYYGERPGQRQSQNRNYSAAKKFNNRGQGAFEMSDIRESLGEVQYSNSYRSSKYY